MRKRFSSIKNINKTNLGKIPNKQGVYGIFTEAQSLLKVGRAKLGRMDDRVLENARELSKAKKFSVITTKTVEDAKKLETRLIIGRNPRFNVEKKGK